MIVDDEELNIHVFAEHLKTDGYWNLVSTNDHLEALSLANRERPDIILLDIHIPRLNGSHVLERSGAKQWV